MWRIAVAMAGVALAACGYEQADYALDYADATCAFTVQCYPDLYETLQACVDTAAVGGTGGDLCTYDPDAARACVSGVEEMGCPAEGALPEFPAACARVFTDCPMDG